MKQITVLSGKGGTGKTTLTASFAVLNKDMVIADCDVDASNLHLLLHPQIIEKITFKGSKIALIDDEKCIQCGKCSTACRFDAIKHFTVDSVLCEGCGVCAHICPVEAIELRERISGYAFISKTKYGPMSHARMIPGEENSGKLVTLVRQNARIIADDEDLKFVLCDGPPGIGCPVIAAVSGIDVGLIVVEPTLSGIHDLNRALSLLSHFKIKPLVSINKWDINAKNTNIIIDFCRQKGIEVVGKIRYDPIVVEAMVSGKPVVEYDEKAEVTQEIKDIWKKINSSLLLTEKK